MRHLSRSFRLLVVSAALAVSMAATSVAVAAEPPAEPSTVLAGSGTLAAGGSGYVRLAGSFVLVGSMDGGWVKVSGLAGPGVVRVTGWASKTRFADGTLLFRGVHGKVYVAGRRITVTMSGPHMRFVATGRGIAFPKGEGIYRLNGGPLHRWTSDGARFAF